MYRVCHRVWFEKRWGGNGAFGSRGQKLWMQLGLPNSMLLTPTSAIAKQTTYSPQYILGACRTFAREDKELAGKYQTMVLSTAGPQEFYQEEDSNEYVFGTFVPTETYGEAALRALRLAHPERAAREKRKIRIVRGLSLIHI